MIDMDLFWKKLEAACNEKLAALGLTGTIDRDSLRDDRVTFCIGFCDEDGFAPYDRRKWAFDLSRRVVFQFLRDRCPDVFERMNAAAMMAMVNRLVTNTLPDGMTVEDGEWREKKAAKVIMEFYVEGNLLPDIRGELAREPRVQRPKPRVEFVDGQECLVMPDLLDK